jgi:hypothetical protein
MWAETSFEVEKGHLAYKYKEMDLEAQDEKKVNREDKEVVDKKIIMSCNFIRESCLRALSIE